MSENIRKLLEDNVGELAYINCKKVNSSVSDKRLQGSFVMLSNSNGGKFDIILRPYGMLNAKLLNSSKINKAYRLQMRRLDFIINQI